MNERRPLSPIMNLLVLIVIAAFALGGYILFFQSLSRISVKDKEYAMLKEKQIKAEENYNVLKKQTEGSTAELEKIKTENQTLSVQNQECVGRKAEIQSRADNLQKTQEKLQKDLNDCQAKLGEPVTPSTQPSTTPATSTQTSFQCPQPDEVTKNQKVGFWDSEPLKWWVDFTSRPLFENEKISHLYKMLYDGQSVACYYALSTNNGEAWMVVKARTADNKPLQVGSEGWTKCPKPDECVSICEKDDLTSCRFGLEKLSFLRQFNSVAVPV